jgi:hypothetical protein
MEEKTKPIRDKKTHREYTRKYRSRMTKEQLEYRRKKQLEYYYNHKKEHVQSFRKAVERHHQDYSKPLEIKFLCSICHKEEHRISKS